MEYSCKLDGQYLRCIITPSRDFTAPVFCFSGMSPMTATEGGHRISGIGSFTEIALPDLKANVPHAVTLKYIGGFTPANRAWMPLGPYLREGEYLTALPSTSAGARSHYPLDAPSLEGLRIVPQPTSFEPSGEHITVFGLCTTEASFKDVAELAERRGFGLFIRDDGHRVTFKTKNLPMDSYQLEITSEEITVIANSFGGRFYAGITLLTLMQTHNGVLPCGFISDTPRFGWRGQHLDTARHFYETKTIRDLLDVMSLLKLNRFHWHFADDEAFRLQVECYPQLWQKTEICGEGHLMPALFSGEIEAGGSYSKLDAQNIIAHAAALNIEVLPEIEAPAHALAMTYVFPEMRDPADNGAEVSVQGYQGNAVNPAMSKTWEVLNAIVAEIGEIFPFGHIHLGCDELPEGTWMGSPKARALMKDLGLETTQDLQGWMIEKLASTVVENGARPAAWEEAAQGSKGGIGNDAILFTWTGQGPGLDAAKAGYDVVMCPAQHVYLDMAHSNDPDDWGASWAAFISLADTINWDPVPIPELADKIIGVQGAFWSEFTTQDAQLWPMILPRILGISVKAWQHGDMTDDQITRLAAHYHSFLQNLE